ncbi:MAG: single-stranded-DNA-specific exonuclease RecJ [Planctomycetota bacterium]
MIALRPPALVPAPDPREGALAKTIAQPDLICRVLLARGIDDPRDAKRYLRPDLSTLADPFQFTHMERAVDRIRTAIREGQRILIHGDYDVDGITGTVLLQKFFGLMQADVKAFIPDRRSGYSFTKDSVEATREGKFDLCISVDNGTNACEAIEQIQSFGCDVIVTDHHGTTDNVARAHTVLNPRLHDAGYPDRELAGCGVAYRLAAAVAQSFSHPRRIGDDFRQFLIDAMAYVALGTVADVAPLRGENRTMVHHGLRALAASRNPGIRALLDCAGVGHRSPDAEDIAFRIAPLINAAGRMGQAAEAVKLLTAPGMHEAQEAAKVLERHNRNRRAVERDLMQRVEELAAKEPADRKIIVLGGEDWHPGVLGIAAARIAETYGKPSILISFDGDVGRGSGRSPGGIHLREAMGHCQNLLGSYGGHAAAAGLEIEREKLDAFREAINEHAHEALSPLPAFEADGEASLGELHPRDIRMLEQLGPFGQGNPRPRFFTRNAKIVGHPTVDTRGSDLRFKVSHEGQVLSARLRGGASSYDKLKELKDPVHLVHSPRLTFRSDIGPLELQVWQIECEDSNGGRQSIAGR